MLQEYKGYNGTLILTDTGVILRRGVKGVVLGGGFLRGDKTIPYRSIVAVQLKRAGLTAGYIQLTLAGGSEAKGGLLESVTDENSIHFHAMGGKNDRFEEAKRLIEQKINEAFAPSVVPQTSGIHELEKLAELRDRGIVTQQEFEAKKKQILGL